MKKVCKKEGLKLENVLVNFDSIIETTDENINKEKYLKIEIILLYLKIKRMMNSKKAQQMIRDNIVVEKKKHYIKGTRISTDSIGNFVYENEISDSKEVLKEYPSIDKEEQVASALFCYVKDNLNLFKLIFMRRNFY